MGSYRERRSHPEGETGHIPFFSELSGGKVKAPEEGKGAHPQEGPLTFAGHRAGLLAGCLAEVPVTAEQVGGAPWPEVTAGYRMQGWGATLPFHPHAYLFSEECSLLMRPSII